MVGLPAAALGCQRGDSAWMEADQTSQRPKVGLVFWLGGRPKRGANEEATQPRSGRPNPTDPGDAADLSIPQGYLAW